MTKPRIDEMWQLYSSDLIPEGYKDYSEPEESEETVTWVWIAGTLGTILVFSVVLCLAWLKKASDELKK